MKSSKATGSKVQIVVRERTRKPYDLSAVLKTVRQLVQAKRLEIWGTREASVGLFNARQVRQAILLLL